jgi:hypothetical protein
MLASFFRIVHRARGFASGSMPLRRQKLGYFWKLEYGLQSSLTVRDDSS